MLPITAYGHPTLKKVGEEITADYPELDKLIEDMFESMHEANGVGLAAQQVNKSIKLFIIDASPYADEYPELIDVKKVLINAQIHKEEGDEWDFEEGCLSVPGINEFVRRKPVIHISYHDENFNFHKNVLFDGLVARIIQHEYDHNQGIVFIERLPHFKRLLLKGKLKDISTGKAEAQYPMIYPKRKTKR